MNGVSGSRVSHPKMTDVAKVVDGKVCPKGKEKCDCPAEEKITVKEAKKKEKKEKPPRKKRKRTKWQDHVMAFKSSHPDLKFKDVLIQAKDSYEKVPGKPKSPEPTPQ